MSQRTPVANGGLGHFRKDLAVRQLSGPSIHVEHTDKRRVVRPVREAGVDDIELLLIGREGKAIGLHEVIDDYLDLAGFRIDPEDVVLCLFRLGFTGDQFPAEYKNGIFIAQHGSWNRAKKIGYRVVFISVDPDGKNPKESVFAGAWLDDQTILGRPADVLQGPDGSLLVADDQAGAIYRISYQK